MRDVSRSELEEYFRFVIREKTARFFTAEQARLIGSCSIEAGVLKAADLRAKQAMKEGLGIENFILSFWVWAFQCGREFENRLYTAENARYPASGN